jgi:hypothetical protein
MMSVVSADPPPRRDRAATGAAAVVLAIVDEASVAAVEETGPVVIGPAEALNVDIAGAVVAVVVAGQGTMLQGTTSTSEDVEHAEMSPLRITRRR